MSKRPIRSTSTNVRMNARAHLNESTSFVAVNKTLISSSSHEKPLNFKLPHLAVPSSRGSNLDTSITAEASEEAISNVKAVLQALWNSKNVPIELQEVFNENVWGLPRHKALTIATREIDDLKHNRSALQSAIRSVIAREESLESIYEMNKYLEAVNGWEKMKDVQLECAELLHAHRILTINAVESIEKWRELIRSSAMVNNGKGSIHVKFVWKKENYLLKMRNDLDFLVLSEFNKVFAFENTDPLMIKPSQPQKRLKAKKIDHNYFIQHGEVVVSLPSSLKPKADFAEEIIGREVKLQMMLNPAQINEIAEVIYEELCEDEANNTAESLIFSNKPEVRQGILEDIIEEEVKKTVEETAKLAKSEIDKGKNQENLPGLMEDMINRELDKLITEIAMAEQKNFVKDQNENLIKQQRLKEENTNLARMIYNDLFGDAIEPLIQLSISEITSANLQVEKRFAEAKTAKENGEIAEKIKISYIEELINSISLEISAEFAKSQTDKNLAEYIYSAYLDSLVKEIAENEYSEEFAKRQSKNAAETADISEKIYASLLDSLMLDLSGFCQESVEEYQQIFTNRSELLENFGIDFASNEVLHDFSGLIFKRISLSGNVLLSAIEEYYEKVPKPEKNISADMERLEQDTDAVEANWFWALIQDNIIGLLVFSVDVDRDDVRVINIHHLTCLDWKFYSNIIEAACKFVWESDNCQEIRVHLYVEGQIEIPPDVKKIFNTLKFRWKTNLIDETQDASIIVMGKTRAMKMKVKETSKNIKKKLLPSKK